MSGSMKVAIPAGPAASQRRRFARAPYVTPVRVLRPGGKVVEGRSEDISAGGLLVVISSPCVPEELVKVRFALPSSGRIVELSAITKWIRNTRGTEAVGFEFTQLPSDSRATIERYVSAMGGH
jgi:c-di-GMP-binding flagellar brake protein YcgR